MPETNGGEVTNAWGEPVEDEDPSDPYWVPEEERKDVDEGPESDALDEETGDDISEVDVPGRPRSDD